MSTHAIPMDEQHFRAAEVRARTLGKTTEQYVASLIDADSSFDDLLASVRQGFADAGDSELDTLLSKARASARKK